MYRGEGRPQCLASLSSGHVQTPSLFQLGDHGTLLPFLALIVLMPKGRVVTSKAWQARCPLFTDSDAPFSKVNLYQRVKRYCENETSYDRVIGVCLVGQLCRLLLSPVPSTPPGEGRKTHPSWSHCRWRQGSLLTAARPTWSEMGRGSQWKQTEGRRAAHLWRSREKWSQQGSLRVTAELTEQRPKPDGVPDL